MGAQPESHWKPDFGLILDPNHSKFPSLNLPLSSDCSEPPTWYSIFGAVPPCFMSNTSLTRCQLLLLVPTEPLQSQLYFTMQAGG